MADAQSEHRVVWRDGGVPVSQRFNDPFFSLQGGLAESAHVFLAGNGLPARLREGFHVAELGFGTGINLIALAACWSGRGVIRFTSFEGFPLAPDDLERALKAARAPTALAGDLAQAWRAGRRSFAVGGVQAEVITGDARDRLPAWAGRADAWFLDGFAPARNPEMWGAALMQAVAEHTSPGGTLATYTAAGQVRRDLATAGFRIERRPGFGSKRHMTTGDLERAE